MLKRRKMCWKEKKVMFTGRNRDSFNKKIKFMLVFLLAFKFFLRLTADKRYLLQKKRSENRFRGHFNLWLCSFLLKQDENFYKSWLR